MRRRAAIVSVHQIKDINVVPMIDVMMFLLVVFIITMPLIEQGIPVNLPQGQADELDQKTSRAITLNLKGDVFLDNRALGMDELAHEMELLGRTEPDATVLVRADEGLPYGRIVQVMKILHDAKLTRMGLVTSPEGKGQP